LVGGWRVAIVHPLREYFTFHICKRMTTVLCPTRRAVFNIPMPIKTRAIYFHALLRKTSEYRRLKHRHY
jgi:hypothetical protein